MFVQWRGTRNSEELAIQILVLKGISDKQNRVVIRFPLSFQNVVLRLPWLHRLGAPQFTPSTSTNSPWSFPICALWATLHRKSAEGRRGRKPKNAKCQRFINAKKWCCIDKRFNSEKLCESFLNANSWINQIHKKDFYSHQRLIKGSVKKWKTKSLAQ